MEWWPENWTMADEQELEEWFEEAAPDPNAEPSQPTMGSGSSPSIVGVAGAMQDMTLSDDQASFHTAQTGDSWEKPPISQDGSEDWRHVRAVVEDPPCEQELAREEFENPRREIFPNRDEDNWGDEWPGDATGMPSLLDDVPSEYTEESQPSYQWSTDSTYCPHRNSVAVWGCGKRRELAPFHG